MDLRLKKAPPTTHKSFEMWQYNNTIGARKYLETLISKTVTKSNDEELENLLPRKIRL